MTELDNGYSGLIGITKWVQLIHWCLEALDEIKRVGSVIWILSLAPLNVSHVLQLVADTLPVAK